MIPSQLQKEEFRFVLINPKEKAPFEKMWQLENNYSFDSPRLIEWISKGGNYGVIGGYGNLLIVDFDNKEFEEKISCYLPDTFTIRTGKGGTHKYYLCDDPQSFKILDVNKNTLADIQGKGKQVVGVGSTHPNGNLYSVCDDKPIATLKISALKIVLGEYLNEKNQFKPRKKEEQICEEIKRRISLSSIMGGYGYDLNKSPTMCKLGHDSAGKKCFSWSDSTGLWYCFHCDRGGDIFNLVMEQENLNFSQAKGKLLDMSGIIIKNEEVRECSLEEIKDSVITNLALKRGSEATEIITEYLKHNYKIYTTRDDEKSEMWIYSDGIYIPQGKTYIKELCRIILGKLISSELINKILLKIETATYIEQEKFFTNQNIELIALKNGILNIRTKELSPFDSKLIFFNKLPVTYDPTRTNKNIITFFNDILPDTKDITVLQEIFGYLLYRDYKYERAFMFLGSGRNGKGKTIELMKRFLGIENCANISLQAIEKDNFAMGELFNKMVNLSADLSKTALEETGNFKSLTGHDLISAPRKFLTRVNFVNYAKMIFCANELPVTRDTSNAFFLRWILIDFPFTFVPKQEFDQLTGQDLINKKIQDTEIIDKISSPSELSGLLNWALIGLDRLFANNGFSNSFTSEQVKNKWLRKSSSINAFIMDCVHIQYDGKVSKKEFRTEYNLYCKFHKLLPISDIEIKETLSTSIGVSEDRITQGDERINCWGGITLRRPEIINSQQVTNGKGGKEGRGFQIDIKALNDFSVDIKNPIHPSHPSHLSNNEPIVAKNVPVLFPSETGVVPSEVKVMVSKLDKRDGVLIKELVDIMGYPEELINKMLTDGDLFQPKPGWVKVL